MNEYDFEWENLGDIEKGRPNLGLSTHVAIYRLMQYTLKSVLENKLGEEETRVIYTEAGKVAGEEFCKNILDSSLPLKKFLAHLHDKLLEYSVGLLKVEKSDTEKMSFVLTVSEDLDCSGLPVNGKTVCDYDEGFLAGIFKVYTGKHFVVKEIDCWATGDRTCRFTVNLSE